MTGRIVRCAILAAVGGVAVPIPCKAEAAASFPGRLTGSVAMVSDYIVRGLSLSNESPAIQGSLDWDSGRGVYASVFGSSVEFGNDASAEIDFLAGYRATINDFHYEIGFAYYWFPETVVRGQNFWDAHVDLGYDLGFGNVTVGLAYTPDDYGPLRDDATLYYKARLALPVAEMMTITAGIGYASAEGRRDAKDWNVGTTFAVFDWFSLDFRYFDTDNPLCGTLCDARAVAKISRSF